MSFIQDKWDQGVASGASLHAQHVNPQMPRVLQIIGFDRKYVRAEGCYLWDDQGKQVLDFLAGYSVFSLGHNPPELLAVLREVLGTSWPNLVQMETPALSGVLASELARRDPGGRLQYAYFGNSGAEAVECALKFARAATRRPRLLSWEGGFHGLTMGALSLCGDPSWKEGFGPFLADVMTVPFGDVGRLEAELRKKDVAALIVEPIQGEGGVRELDKARWDEIQRLCKKYGTLLVLDEIQTGMGRTGKFFAFEHWGIEPDMVCLSKALTNGIVPCSVTLGTRRIFDAVYNRLDRCVVHSSTFGENNLAMAAALCTLAEIDRKGLLENAARMGELLIGRLRAALGGFELVKEVRGRGLMVAIEFGAPKSLSLRMGWSLIQKANKGLFGQMITTPLLGKHQILSQVAGHNLNALKLSPPLIIGEAEVERFVRAVTAVVTESHRFPGGMWSFGLDLAKRALFSPAAAD